MHSQTVRLAITLALIVAGTLVAQQVTGPITVCALVREAQHLDGRIVTVRGILQDPDPTTRVPYLDELAADDCTGLDGKQVTIKVVSPDTHFLARPPRGYRPDMASIRRAERLLAKMSNEGHPRRRIWATVEGVLYIPKPESAPSTAKARSAHKRYQAYIVLQAIRNVSVR